MNHGPMKTSLALAVALTLGAAAPVAHSKAAGSKPRTTPAASASASAPNKAGAPKDGLREIEIATPRVGLAAVLPELAETLGDVDLGPSPQPGTSRVLSASDVREALTSQGISGEFELPHAVRLVRKMATLTPERLDELTREAVLEAGLKTGLRLKTVKAPPRIRVAAGYTRVSAKVARPPRKTGEWTTTVVLSFESEEQLLARVAVPVIFDVSAEAALPDASKGQSLTVVVMAGLVEIRAKGIAGENANVGDVLPITLRPSGRVVRARLVAKDRAVTEGVSS